MATLHANIVMTSNRYWGDLHKGHKAVAQTKSGWCSNQINQLLIRPLFSEKMPIFCSSAHHYKQSTEKFLFHILQTWKMDQKHEFATKLDTCMTFWNANLKHSKHMNNKLTRQVELM